MILECDQATTPEHIEIHGDYIAVLVRWRIAEASDNCFFLVNWKEGTILGGFSAVVRRIPCPTGILTQRRAALESHTRRLRALWCVKAFPSFPPNKKNKK